MPMPLVATFQALNNTTQNSNDMAVFLQTLDPAALDGLIDAIYAPVVPGVGDTLHPNDHFMFGSGLNGAGYVAHTLDDVAQLQRDNKKAILVTDRYSTDLVYAMRRNREAYAGYICLAAKVPGHLISDLVGASLPGLAGFLSNNSGPSSPLVLETGMPIALVGTQLHHWDAQQTIDTTDNVEGLRKTLSDICQFLNRKSPCRLSFKTTLDHHGAIDEVLNCGVNSIGLMRSERLILNRVGGAEDMIKNVLLNPCDEAFKNIGTWVAGTAIPLSAQFIGSGRTGFVRLRLFDFDAQEFLSADEYQQFIAREGEAPLHGAQYALRYPEFYQAQLRSLRHYYDDSIMPVQILIPGVRTLDELLFIRHLYEQELNAEGYEGPVIFSFGIMMETRDAIENSAALAPHVDFVSFGLNDLSSEITGCPRGGDGHTQWVQSHNGVDPTQQLMPDVMQAVEKSLAQLKAANPYITADLCGNHTRLPQTLDWAHSIGISGVSLPSIPQVFLKAKLGTQLRALQVQPASMPTPNHTVSS